MSATGFNHVSISAIDLDESVAFYESLFGLERIPTYTFAFRTQYLRLGDLQLHIFARDATAAPAFHHIGINVDDFEAVYVRAGERGLFDHSAFFHHIYELPDGSVQLYLRDPGGNLVEVDWPDVTTLDRSVVTDIEKLGDHVPQSADAAGASLYLHAREHAARMSGRR